ncbi:MAG TPA: DNA recombination protein RmuC [Methylovirgula sp.]
MEPFFHQVLSDPLGSRQSILLLAASGVGLLLILLLAIGLMARGRRRDAEAAAERQAALSDTLAGVMQAQAELAGRMRGMNEYLGSRHSDLARLVSERLDAVGARVGQGLETQSRTSNESLAKLNERLAVIDAAQARLTGLTEEVIGLKDILANKQARGAFGQGRMEAIIRDALPRAAYEFQPTLSNRTRPDCGIRLPGDDRWLVVDAKFPLESFTALKDADSEESLKQAQSRVRSDVGKHIRDIAERYFLPGETQDLAILFVPSESLYADLAEYFEDVIQKAHKARIIIVSPSLLVMAVQVMQAIVRDARVREQVHAIQIEVTKLVEDVMRLRERAAKVGVHFRQAQDDVAAIGVSAEKIAKRGERIDQMDFVEPDHVRNDEGILNPLLVKAAQD